MTGNLQEPIYMSSRNLQKSQDILTEMTLLHSEHHIKYSDNSLPSKTINSDSQISVNYKGSGIPLNPFITRSSFNQNNALKTLDNENQSSSEQNHLKENNSDIVSMQDSNSSSQYNSGKKLKRGQINIYAILMCISLTILIAIIAIVIPFLVILSRGSETTVMNYFNHASPDGRNQTLNKILASYFNIHL
ncbi:unnamed protein product [Hanseniaspora opuntiae]